MNANMYVRAARQLFRRQPVAIQRASGNVSTARVFTLLLALTTAVAMLRPVLAATPTTSGDDDTLSVRAAAAKHATYRFDTWEQVVHKWRMLGNAGMRLRDLEVFENAGQRIYAGVWEPGSGQPRALSVRLMGRVCEQVG